VYTLQYGLECKVWSELCLCNSRRDRVITYLFHDRGKRSFDYCLRIYSAISCWRWRWV